MYFYIYFVIAQCVRQNGRSLCATNRTRVLASDTIERENETEMFDTPKIYLCVCMCV